MPASARPSAPKSKRSKRARGRLAKTEYTKNLRLSKLVSMSILRRMWTEGTAEEQTRPHWRQDLRSPKPLLKEEPPRITRRVVQKPRFPTGGKTTPNHF